jgi:hypothetical protein
MPVTFTDDEQGKEVVDATGTPLGLVVDVRDETAYVEPDPDFLETLEADAGWTTADGDEYRVDQDAVEKKDDETLYLRGTL